MYSCVFFIQIYKILLHAQKAQLSRTKTTLTDLKLNITDFRRNCHNFVEKNVYEFAATSYKKLNANDRSHMPTALKQCHKSLSKHLNALCSYVRPPFVHMCVYVCFKFYHQWPKAEHKSQKSNNNSSKGKWWEQEANQVTGGPLYYAVIICIKVYVCGSVHTYGLEKCQFVGLFNLRCMQQVLRLCRHKRQ